ncbi:MAG: amidohydrolase [Eubacterium sp.]|nr:amidohydrolase [Eubacterium sp.]
MKNIIESAENIKQEIIDIRRAIHKNPEVGKSLPKTKELVISKLREYGYEPQEICESGIVAVIKGSEKNKTILLRADMDALSVKEETKLSFASDNGAMHACGHDMHTAMLLGAAKLLKEYQREIDGTVKLVFQPDEEGFTGAKEMLKSGVLENPHVDAGLALHVHSGTSSGMILCGLGTTMSGCTLFRIKVKGKGCHGAMPETGVDPINIAAHIYQSLQTINTREISPLNPVVLTIGKFTGGEAPNIIPEEVILEGSIRTLDIDVAKQVFRRVQEIAEQIASSFNGEAIVTEIASAPPLINDKDMTGNVADYLKEICNPDTIVLFEQGGMGSEDFASYTYEIPCSYLVIGAGTAQENELYGKPMHNSGVVFNEDILPIGSAVYAYSAIKWLQLN